MGTDARTKLRELLASGQAALHPLTFPQRELWESSAVPPLSTANHICAMIEVRGVITPGQCEAALQKVVDRQEVLRLAVLPGKERPLQLIRRASPVAMSFSDLKGSNRREEALDERMQAVFSEPFDMVAGPLYRVDCCWRGSDDLVLIFAIHHAIADGWSLGVLVEDLCSAYALDVKGGGGALPAVPLAYSAWGGLEREAWSPAKIRDRAGFWQEVLRDAPRLWDSSACESRSLERFKSFIAPSVTGGIREAARMADATLFSTLLAGFQIALHRWLGKEDIVVGTPVANRTKYQVKETMGSFAGVVPLRGRIAPDRPFDEVIRETHRTAVECFGNTMPFVELAHAMGEAHSNGRNPVFDVRFALQNHPVPDIDLPGLSARLRMHSTGTARFDLGCEITEARDGLEVVWLFRPGLFSRADVEEVDAVYRELLDELCVAPRSRISALSV